MMDFSGKKAEFVNNYITRILQENPNKYPSKAAIARMLNVLPQYLNSILSGKRNVSDKFFKKFTETFGVNQNELDCVNRECDDWNSSVSDQKQSDTRIPLVGIEAIGGFGSADFAIREQDIKAHYEVPDFYNVDFMIRVKGSSMYPKYNSGDVVACRKIVNSKFIQWGKVYVIATREQGILIKRLDVSSSKNSMLAISDNHSYKPFEIPNNEITGIALVIGVIRLE